MLRTVIVEDEPLARDLLRSHLALHDDIELVGEARDGKEGIELVNALSPDLVLLDIQLPAVSGLSVAQQIKRHPAIIFVTAFDQHAMTAFELGAFDYLLKPVTPGRFALALQRFRERRGTAPHTVTLGERIECVLSEGFLQRFFVRHLGTLHLVHVPEVLLFQAEDDYTAVQIAGRRYLMHVPLRVIEARLDPQMFLRVHRSTILNLSHVRSGRPDGRRYLLELKDGTTVASSRSGAKLVHDLRL